jgi:hypothetical protein
MKLHRNAALSLKKRELLAHRVIDEEWSLTEAATASIARRNSISCASSRSRAARYSGDSPGNVRLIGVLPGRQAR